MSHASATVHTALVMGAAGGIGRAVVRQLTAAGMNLVAADLCRPDDLATPGTHCIAIEADGSVEQDVRRVLAAALEAFGRIDFAVNLIGVVGSGKLADTSLEAWQSILDANLNSCFLLAKHAYPALRASQGSLLLCSSTNGVNGGSQLSGAAYACAKAAIINLTRYLANEWANDDIRVNCLIPGPVDTPMLRRLPESEIRRIIQTLPLGRLITPDEVAEKVLRLSLPESLESTGTMIDLSGGLLAGL